MRYYLNNYLFHFILLASGTRIRTLYILLIACNYSLGQDLRKIDSLSSLLTISNKDTNRVWILIKISEEYSLTDPPKSLQYADQAMNLSEHLSWKKGIAMAYNRIGYTHDVQGNFPLALEYRLKELKIREELYDKKARCNSLAIIGITYSDMGNFTEAMEYYISSLKLAEEIGDIERRITNLCNIASVHKELGDTTKALEYYFKSLGMAKENNYENFVSVNYGNIGNIYNEQRNYTKALDSYFSALEIDQKLRNKRNIAGWLCNIGDAFRFQSDSAIHAGMESLMQEKIYKAKEYYLEAIDISREVGNNYILSNAFLGIGETFLIGRQYADAKRYLEKSFQLASEINYPDIIMLAHKSFFELYKRTDEHEKSLDNFEKYITIKDSLFNEKTRKIISELQIKYETEKKENENRKLFQQNEVQATVIKNNKILIIALGGILILVIIVGVLLFRQNKLKAENVAMQFQQKLLRAQMNPHFIFNSLSSIESFIYEHQPKEAGVYLSSFARLMRLILESSASESIMLEKEIKILNFYLSLQKLRLNDNFDYRIEIDPLIKTEAIYLPPMLTQPFIENAIEHGFKGVRQKGQIEVLFNMVKDNLQVQISDNGIGITRTDQQKDIDEFRQSMAMKITEERLKLLNKSRKRKLHLTVTNLYEQTENKGTKVIFSIPV